MSKTSTKHPPRLQEFTPSTLPDPKGFQDLQIILQQPSGSRTILFSDGQTWSAPGGATSFAGLSDAASAPIATVNTSVAQGLAARATLTAFNAHQSNTNNPHGVTKAQVGLSDVDNTSDLAKPVSTAVQAALNAIVVGAGASDMILNAVQTVTGAKTFASAKLQLAGVTSGVATLNAPATGGGTLTLPPGTDSIVGRASTDVLTNKTLTDPTIARIINNAALINLPTVASTLATLAGIELLSNKTIFSPALTGAPVAPTQAQGSASTLLANTLYVDTGLAFKANSANPTFSGTVSGITAAMVGLGSVNNTSDANKPVSTATANALTLKANADNPAFTGTATGLTKAMVGLANADNTSDALKPLSNAAVSALLGKQDSLVAGSNISIVGSTISSVGGAGGGSAALVAYSLNIPLDTAGAGKRMAETTLALNSTFVPTGSVEDGVMRMVLKSNGTNTPNFAAFTNLNGYAYPTATAGARSLYVFSYLNGEAVMAGAALASTDITAPTILSALAGNTTPDTIEVTLSEPYSGAISAAAAWAINAGHAITAAGAGSSSSKVNLTTSTPFVFGEAARTLTYTQPATNKMQDASGNLMPTQAGVAITNNVNALPTITGVVVQVGAPAVAEVTLSENYIGTLPASSAFGISAAHTVTAIGAGSAANKINVTVSPDFAAGEVRTIAYTKPGSNQITGAVSGQQLATVAGVAITNNVLGGGVLSITNVGAFANPLDITAAADLDYFVKKSGSSDATQAQGSKGAGLIAAHAFYGGSTWTNPIDGFTVVNWTDSIVETASGTNNETGIAFTRTAAVEGGYKFTVPASTTQRKCIVQCLAVNYSYVDGISCRATLSDGAVAAQTLRVAAGGSEGQKAVANFEITLKAGTNGQTCLIELFGDAADGSAAAISAIRFR